MYKSWFDLGIRYRGSRSSEPCSWSPLDVESLLLNNVLRYGKRLRRGCSYLS